jgi:hypothetical protein
VYTLMEDIIYFESCRGQSDDHEGRLSISFAIAKPGSCDIIWAIVNVFTVATDLLGTVKGKMAQIRLQKICYYCQAWYLAWHGEPLFLPAF